MESDLFAYRRWGSRPPPMERLLRLGFCPFIGEEMTGKVLFFLSILLGEISVIFWEEKEKNGGKCMARR